ncbi:MAG: Calx-beta domain-containing protein, partial [Planctomycetota bacterium]
MLLTNWLRSIACKCRPARPRFIRNQRSRVLQRFHSVQSQRVTAIEQLEDRTMLTSVITIDDVSIEEDAGLSIVIFTLTRTGTNPGDLNSSVEINFTTQDGTATGNDVDYNSVTGTLYFFSSATATSQTTTMHVGIADDLEVEGNETFQFLISTISPDTIIEKNIGVATIIDNEAVSLSVSDATAYENDTLSFDITLSQVASSDITFLATTVAGSAEEGGSQGDYTYFQNKQVTIKVGEISTTVTVHPLDDNNAEPDETFSLVISDPKINGDSLPSTVMISDDTGLGTILNDDHLPGSTFNIEGTKVIEGHDGTTYLEFTITRTGESAGDLNFLSQVLFNTIDGSATAGEDYASTVRVLDFTASSSATSQSQTVEVPIFGDTVFEATETFIGRLSNATGGSVLKGNVATLDAMGVITNDESDFTFRQSFTADPLFSNHSYDHVGRFVAVDGDVMVIGVPNNSANEDNAPGSAYVYIRNQQGTPTDLSDDTWDFQTVLRPENQTNVQYFGASIAIHDGTIVIGSYDNYDSNRVLYVFSRVGSDWKTAPPQRESIILPPVYIHDFYGKVPIDVFGDTIVAANYVFEKSGADWSAPLTTQLLNSGVTSVAIHDGIIVMGNESDYEKGSRAGAIYIFSRTGINWHSNIPQETKITASDATNSAYFGTSVSYDGDQIAVGAVNPLTGTERGKVYIYTRNGSDWNTLPPDETIFTADDGVYHFGASVSLSDNHLVIGSYNAEYDTEASSVYVYTKNGANWDADTAIKSVLNAPVNGNLLFGEIVFISGTTIFVGAPLGDTDGKDSGTIYVFELNQSDSYQLIHEINPTASVTAHNGGDKYGRRIAI